MTPLRIAVMLGGCWVIPTFISFLPIMQGWNSIGIIDLVSSQGGTIQCAGCSLKSNFSGKGKKEGEISCSQHKGDPEFLQGIFKGG